jgi:hypothetical protein
MGEKNVHDVGDALYIDITVSDKKLHTERGEYAQQSLASHDRFQLIARRKSHNA